MTHIHHRTLARKLAVLGACVGMLLSVGALPCTALASEALFDTQTWSGNTPNPYGGQDYFVDSRSGEDASTGTSAQTPWKNLTRVHTVTFQPGDRILLKAGSVWNDQQLWPQGSGAEDKPITIAAYGDSNAAKPYIATNGKVDIPFTRGKGTGNPLKDPQKVGTTGAVVLRNQHHWEIRELSLSNDDDFSVDKTARDGTVWDGISISINADILEKQQGVEQLKAHPERTVMKHFRVDHVDVHHLDSPDTWQKIYTAGVNFQVFGSKNHESYEYAPGGYHFDDIRIEKNTFDTVDLNAIQAGFNWFGDGAGEKDSSGKWHDGWEHLWVRTHNQYTTQLYIGNNSMHSIGQGAIQVGDSKNVLMEYNTVNGYLKRYRAQSCAIYAYASADVLIRYNEVFDGAATTYDGTPWDFEYNDFNVVYEHNYSHDNGAGWFAYMGNTDKAVARYNLSVNDNGTMIREFMSGNYSPTYFTNNVIVYKGGARGQGKTQAEFHNKSFKSPLYFVNNVFYNYDASTQTRWRNSERGEENIDNAIFYHNVFFEASGKHKNEPRNEGGSHEDPHFVGYAGEASIPRLATFSNTSYSGAKDTRSAIRAVAQAFTPAAGSPLIDTGLTTASQGTSDILGHAIQYGTASDIGIVEVDKGEKNAKPFLAVDVEHARENLAQSARVVVSSQHPSSELRATNLTDGNGATRWAAHDDAQYPLDIDIHFGREVMYNTVKIDEYVKVFGNKRHPEWDTHERIQRYSLWRWNDASHDWVKFYTADTGARSAAVFSPQSSTQLRIHVESVYSGRDTYRGHPSPPTISEITVSMNIE
ncbi:hypothetical protein ALMA_0806 [Alloscardovia macacae]|uniref:F5/8 type C domain-containing protein n=2 Tax=Alloscardovia macacae TaxID=1160091 RepID=A0A261F5J6_9BIFI|nr:hypothetical protein ALMA_0806 [Alloscardovia macacae]